jgi:uncharacterized membrane protein
MLRRLTQPDLPVDTWGFRLRGLEMTRLETFVDAAFAFSVTMLALSPDQVPRTFDEMIVLLKGVPAFIASLSLLLLFWNGHVKMSRRYGLDDAVTTLLSGAFIAVMLVYVYPLKFMVGSFFEAYIPPLRTPTFVNSLNSTQQLSTMFIAMSSGFVAMHFVLMLMDTHAFRVRARLGLTSHEARLVRCEIGLAWVYMTVGLASIGLAIAFRGSGAVVWAGFVYAALGGLIPAYWMLAGPSRHAIREAVASGSVNAPDR